ncbi:MAG: NBR1-Ig-like domain-containing protein [Chloroflexota bacterium]|nr:NBR1-Ig-like domain-containing protein [Chloroflexota bacterium]
MTRLSLRNILLFVVVLAFLGACNMPKKAAPNQESSGIIYTVAAQTVQAQMTQSASGEQNTPQPVQTIATTAVPSDASNPPPTDTQPAPAPTNTPLPTNTPPPTPTEIPCDHIDFGDPIDITIPDGTEINPGDSFTKTWRLKNGGSCTWTSGYDLVFVTGDNMSAPASQQLTSGTVAPGQEIDVSVNLVAPDDPGDYRGYFKLRNPSGVLFGWGDESKSFWADIEVPDISGVMFDFIARADEAEWGSGTTPMDFDNPGTTDIDYGGPDTDANGFAMVKDGTKLEDGDLGGKILETHPKWVNDGYIIGRYPAYDVGSGDYIKGHLGFIAFADGSCGGGDAKFRIYYTIGNDMGTLSQLGSWHETCDGTMKKINIDINSLKGKTVHFYLVVLANGSAGQDWAVWDSLGVMR